METAALKWHIFFASVTQIFFAKVSLDRSPKFMPLGKDVFWHFCWLRWTHGVKFEGFSWSLTFRIYQVSTNPCSRREPRTGQQINIAKPPYPVSMASAKPLAKGEAGTKRLKIDVKNQRTTRSTITSATSISKFSWHPETSGFTHFHQLQTYHKIKQRRRKAETKRLFWKNKNVSSDKSEPTDEDLVGGFNPFEKY